MWSMLCRLEKLNRDLEQVTESVEKGRALFVAAVAEVNRRIDEEKQKYLQPTASSISASANKKKGTNTWSTEELNLLIKAVNLFPAGTNQRYGCLDSIEFQTFMAAAVGHGDDLFDS